MLDYLISGLINMLERAFSSAVDMFLSAFNFSKEQFLLVFPFANISFSLFQGFAMGLVLLIAGLTIINFVRSGSRLRENPMGLVFRAIIAVIGIYMGNYILESIISLASANYNVILGSDIDSSFITDDFQGVSLAMSVISSVFYKQSIVLYLILVVMIGYQMILVLLEAVERFVVLYVLLFISPPFFATLTSRQTSNIFSKFINMFISQCILMIANVWFLKMALSVFASIGTIGNNASPVIPMIMAFALLRVAQRFDNTLNQLGLNGAITGAGLGADLLGSALAMGRGAVSSFGSLLPNNGGSGGGNGVMGMAQKAANAYGRHSVFAGGADYVKNNVKATGSTILGAIKNGQAANRASGATSFADGAKAFADGFNSHIQENADTAFYDAKDKTEASNIFMDMVGGQTMDGNGVTATEKFASAIVDTDTPLTENQIHSVRSRPAIANEVFDRISQDKSISVMDNTKNAAMLASMGLADGENFVRTADGNLSNATNFESRTDKNGIIATYDTYRRLNEDGTPNNPTSHSMRVVSKQMFDSMTESEKTGFQAFNTTDGKTNYVRYDGNDVVRITQRSDYDDNSDIGEQGGLPPTSLPPTSIPPTSLPPTDITPTHTTTQTVQDEMISSSSNLIGGKEVAVESHSEPSKAGRKKSSAINRVTSKIRTQPEIEPVIKNQGMNHVNNTYQQNKPTKKNKKFH